MKVPAKYVIVSWVFGQEEGGVERIGLDGMVSDRLGLDSSRRPRRLCGCRWRVYWHL